ncbi:MAG: hypothetical protein IJK56_06700 [Firmicutes bacterium]|nr:hypothetical protein [Bacillota bacterium]
MKHSTSTYYLIRNRIIGRKLFKAEDEYEYQIYVNGKWVPDDKSIILDHLFGFDPSEPAGSPYAMGNIGIMDRYYETILSDPKAVLVKCLDRCNNITTMSWGLSRDRIYRTIWETEKYYPRLLEVLKNSVEYDSAYWLLKYQMESMLDIYKRLL